MVLGDAPALMWLLAPASAEVTAAGNAPILFDGILISPSTGVITADCQSPATLLTLTPGAAALTAAGDVPGVGVVYIGIDSSTGGALVPADPPAEPLDGEDLAQVLQRWIVGLTGLPGSLVRPRWQVQPPAQPEIMVNWAAIGVLSETAEAGFPIIYHDGAADSGLGRDHLRRHKTLEVLASFYGPRGPRYAQQVMDGAYIAQNSEVLSAAQLALIEVGTARAVPEPFQLQWLMRVDLTIRLRRVVDREYLVRNIVDAEGAIVTPDVQITWST